LFLAIVLPIVFFVWHAWNSLQTDRQTAYERVDRLARVAEEHALKIFEINSQLMDRSLGLVSHHADEAISADELMYHEALVRIDSGILQLKSINVWGRDGHLRASNLFYPAPRSLSIADHPEFLAHKNGAAKIISPVIGGRLSGNDVFSISAARHDAQGRFAGVVSIALLPKYFADYYGELVVDESGVAVALMHRDGSLIARYPPPPAPALNYSRRSAILERINQGALNGSLTGKSAVDGMQRYFNFRSVKGTPLFVVASVATTTRINAWYQHIALVAAFTFIPSIALCGILLLAMHRLKGEEEAWNQWRAEAMQRQSMEIAYRQARRLEALGQLTGGVAHDFNNLLMVVSTSTMLLRRKLVGQPEMEQPLGALERSIESGKRLTRQLLAFSRKQPLDPEVVDVGSQMTEFFELVRASLGARIMLRLDMQPDVKHVYVDEGELELAMLNLALNARDAMPEGGTLTIRVRNVLLDEKSDPTLRGEFVAIAFEDTGEGIAEEHLLRIFEAFYTTKAPGRGTGLGLAQVHGFCEQAGGAVRVHSKVGTGTSVTMYLAVSTRQLISIARAGPQIIRPRSSGNVLLVEDNAEVAEAAKILLEELGYGVDTVSTAEEALALISEKLRWDIVVSDVLMPGSMGGIALARRLRASYPELPVLLITGYTAQLEQARQAGLHVLAKPFNAVALSRALESIRPSAKS
jgi:signal transduction histidine kinase/CheY-like chemotaxis protein